MERLALLRVVPFGDQPVPEGQAGRGIRGGLVTIEHATGERRFDMADDLFLEALRVCEGEGLVFLPGRALRLGNRSCPERATLAMLTSEASRLIGPPSTLLISPAPKPVTVLLCLRRVRPGGPTGPIRSEMGAPVLGRRSRIGDAGEVMMGI
jgi:hypothetical protein